ncbi:MAG: cobalamin-dependent protein, partial [Deltaproteobacteria bacterium]|nr:cobalamin-dependent protein [Deltaproteobacteria bacterium]
MGSWASLVDGPTRCLLVRPRFSSDATFYGLRDLVWLTGKKSAAPPLGLLMVANLLPRDWEVKLVDEEVEPLTDTDLRWADVVMVSGITSQLEPMALVLRRARALDKPTVVGGSGPTLQPGMYLDLADFVVVGEAEDTVSALLEDLRSGVTSGTYRSQQFADLTRSPVPRYDLCRLDAYMFIGVGYSRGC